MNRPAETLALRIIAAMVAVARKAPPSRRVETIQLLAPLTSRLTTRLLLRDPRRYYR